jgi:nicotinate-nucleotide adenylyltransferase
MTAAAERAPKRVGVMGGTFDPIHLGHLVAATEAAHRFDLDRVLFVPAGEPWQKERYSSPEDRYLMTVLGTEGHRSFSASRVELDRRGPTYTADTIEELTAFYGDDIQLFFVAGADAMLRLGTWRHLDRLESTVQMIAVTRPGFDLSALAPEPGWPRVHSMDMPPIGISASDIRQRVRQSLPIDFMVPPTVHDYVRRQGLYV